MSVSEEFITDSQRQFITLCHNLRNDLYHAGTEEELLVKAALLILHDIIMVKQPEWKSASLFTRGNSKAIDPYRKLQLEAFKKRDKSGKAA